MTKRQVALTEARVAGYHADTARFTRLLIESRVARQAMNEAWVSGRTASQRGVRCDCRECRK